MTVYGDGKQTRSFQYVSDLVSISSLIVQCVWSVISSCNSSVLFSLLQVIWATLSYAVVYPKKQHKINFYPQNFIMLPFNTSFFTVQGNGFQHILAAILLPLFSQFGE